MATSLYQIEMSKAEAEVIIVGGGPAGVATGVALARAGRRVVLCEARSFKQSQLSDLSTGEVLSPGAQLELRRLGFPCESSAAWRLEDFGALRQFWTPTRTTRLELPAKFHFWQIDRGKFDQALLDFASWAGVEVRLGHRVKGPLTDPHTGAITGINLHTPVSRELFAPLIVDAAGRNSPLLARLGLKQPEKEFQRFAVVCFFSDVPGAIAGEWEQHFLRVANTTLNGSRLRPDLYRYTLETDLSRRAEFPELHRPLELFLALLDAARPSLATRFRAATPLPYATAFGPVGYRVARLTQPGLVLVGDATGYLDPATGQGIEFALRSARLVAQAIGLASTKPNHYNGFEVYEKGLGREVSRAKRDLRLYLRFSRQKIALEAFSHSGLLRTLLMRRLVKPRPPPDK